MDVKLIRTPRIVYFIARPRSNGDFTVHAVLDNYILGPAIDFCSTLRTARAKARRLYLAMVRKN